ncbi:MAG: YpdA family putative bacillithiol disulfide reductase [Flavipsychrobacter sp.]|nr:YpdA family putative bacillithiol disulfide reductase [Flavipsychrobacter sp.]
MKTDYDVVVIGSGPIGLSCGIEAKAAGLTYIIIDKGCLVNSLFNYPLNMSFFSTSEKLEIGNVPFMSVNTKPNRAEALEYYRRVTALYNLNIHLFETVHAITPAGNQFEVKTSKANYTTGKVIISTGFYDIPATIDVPGEDLSKVMHYYRDPHFYAMQHVVIAGASNSAVDAALETYRKGAHVTMVIRGPQVGERVKYWVRPDIINRINEGSIKAYYNSNLTAIRQTEVDIQTLEGKVTLPNDFVIALTGYRPDFSLLTQAGVNLSEPRLYPTHNTDTMETNIPGIYLAGVVCGGLDTHKWFIENSRDHAGKIIRHIKSLEHSL